MTPNNKIVKSLARSIPGSPSFIAGLSTEYRKMAIQLRMKPYHQRSVFADPDFSEINQRFLGTKLPMPDLDKEASPVCIGPRTVEMIVYHTRARGRSSPFNVQFRVRFRGEGRIVMVGITVAKFPTAVNLFAHTLRAFGMSPLIRYY